MKKEAKPTETSNVVRPSNARIFSITKDSNYAKTYSYHTTTTNKTSRYPKNSHSLKLIPQMEKETKPLPSSMPLVTRQETSTYIRTYSNTK
jgi:hypothetical protein